MKKTGTTILSLALALILVSSLSSGVILAKEKKTKYKTVKVHQVAILECLTSFGAIVVDAFDFSGELPDDVMIMTGDLCAASLASLRNAGFEMQGNTGITEFVGPRSRYTLGKTTKMRVPVVNGDGDDDDDDDDD